MSGWRRFWEGAHWLYVNERHSQVHYRQVADDILSVLPASGTPCVLDYGCGEALEADRVAARTIRLYLYDASADTRARLKERFGEEVKIAVLDDMGLAALSPAALDIMIVNSVAQYLERAELLVLLSKARHWLKPGGQLVLADVIPPNAGALADISSLLRTALRHGFLIAALGGLAATFFSDYRRLRQTLGLSTYTDAEMCNVLSGVGFGVERRGRNFGFNARRMTFLARNPG